MAIDVFKRQGKSAVTGLLGKNLRRIAGNVGSVIRGEIGSESSETAPINRTKQSTKMLSFPIDVGADPGIGNHGHYVMFFINQQVNAKLKFGEEAENSGGGGTGPASMIDEAKRKGLKAVQKVYDSKAGGFLNQYVPNITAKNLLSGFTDTIAGFKVGKSGKIKTEVKHQNKEAHRTDTTVAIERAPTKRLDTVISMYMPMQVEVSYKSQYQDTPIGILTSSVVDIASSLMATGEVDQAKLETAAKEAGVGLERAAVGMVSELGPGLGGLKEAVEMKKGVIVADRLELAFKGIDKRTFNYTFKMIPRSQTEAEEIKKIINAFKFNMLPEFADGGRGGRSMTVPNTFDIQYMYQNSENNFLHRISTCYLTDMNVKYGGSRYKTFDGNADGAPPVETEISLNFSEIELITRERAQEGF